jgi:hypothetical protein
MAINFYLDREQLAREIEKWIASSNLDLMLVLCRFCVNNLYKDSNPVTECIKCSIQQAIEIVSDNREWTETRDFEFLGVC